MKIAILVIILLAAAGAGAYFFLLKPAGEEEPAGPAQPAAGQEPRKLTHAEKEKIAQQKLAELRRMARTDRDNLLGMKALRDQVIGLFPEGGGTATVVKARAEYTKAERDFLSRARKKYQEHVAEIKGKFKGLQENPTEAVLDRRDKYQGILAKVDDLPPQFASTEYATKLPKLKEPIQRAIEACNAYEKLREEAVRLGFDGKYEAAIAKLNEFPERFRKDDKESGFVAEWEPIRQKLIGKYSGELATEKAEKKKEEELTFYDLYHGQPLEKADWDAQGWELKDGVLIGNKKDSSFSYNYGNDWEDIVLVIEMRLVRGSVTLGVRGTQKPPGSGHYFYDPIRLSVGEMEPNKWYILTVKLRGDNYTVTGDPGLLRLVEESMESNKEKKIRGPVSFFLNENTEIHIKSVRIAFFDRIPASFANEAAKQQEDGRAKKLGEGEEEEKEEGEE